jgi:hypothetical protein
VVGFWTADVADAAGLQTGQGIAVATRVVSLIIGVGWWCSWLHVRPSRAPAS